jgi:cell shape-determining protein MreC
VLPPGNDGCSRAFAGAANQMVQAHRAWNQARQDELTALIDKVTAAVNTYKQTEHDNTMRA